MLTIAEQKDYPSWGYMVSQGATTIWELWNGNTADPAMNSHNHVMLVGDLVIWFYEYLAGIQPDEPQSEGAQPGFKHIVMRPHPVGNLTSVKASFRSPYGMIRSEWDRNGQKSFDWKISVPANTTATIYITDYIDDVTEGGRPVKEVADVKVVKWDRLDGNQAIFEIGSGEYHFVCRQFP